MYAVPRLIQFVSHFAPTRCGVGDYARLLGAEWRRQQGGHSRILVADDNWPEGEQPAGWEVRRLRRRRETWADLAEQPPVGAVLQYSGYGYARRGAPLWLLPTLQSFKRRFPKVPLITMFHEVAASGPITTSAFWLRPLQLYVARRLRELSDAALTNCEVNAKALNAVSSHILRQLVILPVVSNFGELDNGESWSERVRRIVVFNSNFGGQMPGANYWQGLADGVRRAKVSEVIMIGRPVLVPAGLNFPVVQPGFLTAEEVSAILAKSAFGHVFHGPLLLGKSGIFAAFAAHGVVPLIQTVMETLPDGLVAGRTYLALRHEFPCGDDTAYFDQISRNVREWYMPHGLAATAEVYADLIERHKQEGCLS